MKANNGLWLLAILGLLILALTLGLGCESDSLISNTGTQEDSIPDDTIEEPPEPVDSAYQVRIETMRDAIQGKSQLVPVTLTRGYDQMAGLDFLIAYDASALSFQAAFPGPLFGAPPGCGWEYFTYRFGPDGNCGDACPSGMLRVVAIAETNNGPSHPDWECYDTLLANVPFSLFTLDFMLTNDRTYECQLVPIRFFWMDCGDNSIAFKYRTDPWTLVQGVSRYVIEFDSTNHIENATTGFPTYTGVQDGCLSDSSGHTPGPVPFVDFYNGGIDVICADSIDFRRGDINLNRIANEIADAILFSNYFLLGSSIFTVNLEWQIAASDVNEDGIVLGLADLVYLTRIITGDALPPANLTPDTAIVSVADNVISVDAEMGAAFVVAAGNVYPTLLADEMDMMYRFDGVNTRILVSSMDMGATFEGDFLRVDGEIISIELATYEGAPVTVTLLPVECPLPYSYPNPFMSSTTIVFTMPEPGEYSLTIYNVLGEEVVRFVDTVDAGAVMIMWDATGFPEGVYFLRLEAGSFVATHRMILLRP